MLGLRLCILDRVRLPAGGRPHLTSPRPRELSGSLTSNLPTHPECKQERYFTPTTWNLELGINDFVQKSMCTSPDRNIQTTAYYEYTHNLAHLFLAHEGPNPLCAVVVIATTYESMYLALYRRDITLLFVVRHEQRDHARRLR